MSTGFLQLTWILYCSLKHAPTPFLMNCGSLILVFQMVALYPFFSTLNMRYASKSGSDEEVIPPNSKSVFAHLFLNSITDIHVLPIKSSVFISLFHICQFFSCSGCNWFLFTLFCFILVTVVQCLSRSHQQADTWTCKAASWSEFHAPGRHLSWVTYIPLRDFWMAYIPLHYFCETKGPSPLGIH